MRACACDTATRLCVRTVLCSSAFSLAPPLRSTGSATAETVLFARFIATMSRSDFSTTLIVGYGLRPSRRGPGHDWWGLRWKSPGSRTKGFCAVQGLRRRGAGSCLAMTTRTISPSVGRKTSASELVLRRSIPSLRTPLSTLRLQPHDRTRMTRGRCGSLRLRRDGLAPSTFRRSPGAPVHSIIRIFSLLAACFTAPSHSPPPRLRTWHRARLNYHTENCGCVGIMTPASSLSYAGAASPSRSACRLRHSAAV